MPRAVVHWLCSCNIHCLHVEHRLAQVSSPEWMFQGMSLLFPTFTYFNELVCEWQSVEDAQMWASIPYETFNLAANVCAELVNPSSSHWDLISGIYAQAAYKYPHWCCNVNYNSINVNEWWFVCNITIMTQYLWSLYMTHEYELTRLLSRHFKKCWGFSCDIAILNKSKTCSYK